VLYTGRRTVKLKKYKNEMHLRETNVRKCVILDIRGTVRRKYGGRAEYSADRTIRDL
jgi:hypothetical protein